MLQNKLDKYQLVLASKSPRRKQLLESLGLHFDIQTKDIEEVYPSDLKGEEIPMYLSKLKASAFDKDNLKDKILITSDTVVWFNNQKLGKPKDRGQAIKTLQSLSNNSHEVISGVTLTSHDKQTSFSVTTKVYFGELSQEEIEYYVDTYKPFDKAGSYGIQEWIGMIGVNKIEGDYYNVVGLPVYQLKKHLIDFVN